MTEITQADRIAAAALKDLNIIQPKDEQAVESYFAIHRQYGYDHGRTEERAAVVDIVKGRIDIINGFINGLADNKIKVPDELFSALVELRSLLRELQQ